MTVDEFLLLYPGGDSPSAEITVRHWVAQAANGGYAPTGFYAEVSVEHDPPDGDSDVYESGAWPTSAEAIADAIEHALRAREEPHETTDR